MGAEKARILEQADREAGGERAESSTVLPGARYRRAFVLPVAEATAREPDGALRAARAALVKARSELIICARGLLKSFGERVAVSGSDNFAQVALESLPELVCKPLSGLLEAIACLTEQILGYDKSIEEAAERYSEVACITTVPCIGTLTALSFVLTVEDPSRIARSRLAGCFCGLRPKRSQSGERDPQLGISKTGDGYLRTLLVQCAHHLLGWRGKDCALRRWGCAWKSGSECGLWTKRQAGRDGV